MKPKNEQRALRNILVNLSFVIFFLAKCSQSAPNSRKWNEVVDKLNLHEKFRASPSPFPSPAKLGVEENPQFQKTHRSSSHSENEFRGERAKNSQISDAFETYPPISKKHWNKLLKSIGIRDHAYFRGKSRNANDLAEGEQQYKHDLYFKHGKSVINVKNEDPNFDFISFIEHFFGDLKDSGIETESGASQSSAFETPQSLQAAKSIETSKRSHEDGELAILGHDVSSQDLPAGTAMRLLPEEGTEWVTDHRNLSRKRRQKVSSGDDSKAEGSVVRRKRRRKHRHRPRTTDTDLTESGGRKDEKISSNNHPEKFLLKSDSPSYVITSASELKKDWCRTVPLRQKVVERNCRPKVIMNNFCYGQCNSFFIPHPGKTGSHSAAFQSCAFCKPHRPKWTNVTLHCPGQNPPRKEKRVLVVESCRCITEVFQ